MVFLAITPTGLAQALRAAEAIGAPVWCGSDALPQTEFLARQSTVLTRLNYELGTRDPDLLLRAFNTIDQHHSGAVVWMEAEAPKD